MAISVWNHIKGFSPQENWGDHIKMSGFLLLAMSAVRGEYLFRVDPDARFIIHCAYEVDGHEDNSQHPLGNAVDFHIITRLTYITQIGKLLEIFDGLQIANRIGFGIYPTWNNPGYHFDVRGTLARWGKVNKEYLPFKKTISYIIEKSKQC